jgi:hypothetical protein
VSKRDWVRAASRSAVTSRERARSSSAARRWSEERAAAMPGLRGAEIGLGLVGLEAREGLAERDARALLDEHLAEATDEIEADGGLALALDGAPPEGLLADVAAIDVDRADAHRGPEARARDEQARRDEDDEPEALTQEMSVVRSGLGRFMRGAPGWTGARGGASRVMGRTRSWASRPLP